MKTFRFLNYLRQQLVLNSYNQREINPQSVGPKYSIGSIHFSSPCQRTAVSFLILAMFPGCAEIFPSNRTLNEAADLHTKARQLEQEGKYDESERAAEAASDAQSKALKGTLLEATIVKMQPDAMKWTLTSSRLLSQGMVFPVLEPAGIDLRVMSMDMSMFFDSNGLRIQTISNPDPFGQIANLSPERNADARSEQTMGVQVEQLKQSARLMASFNATFAVAATRAGDFELAEKLLKQKPEDADWFVTTRFLIADGKLKEARADQSAAESKYIEALRLIEQSDGEMSPWSMGPYLALSMLYQNQKRYADLERIAQRHVNIAKAVGAPAKWTESYTQALNNLAVARAHEGDLLLAEQLFGEAIKASSNINIAAAFGGMYWEHNIQSNFANVLWRRGNLSRAYETITQEVTRDDATDWAANSSGSEKQRLEKFTNRYAEHHAIATLALATRQPLDQAYGALLRGKGGFQDSQIQNVGLWRFGTASDQSKSIGGVSYEKLLDELRAVNSELGAITWRGVAGKPNSGDEARFSELTMRANIMAVNLARGGKQRQQIGDVQINAKNEQQSTGIKRLLEMVVTGKSKGKKGQQEAQALAEILKKDSSNAIDANLQKEANSKRVSIEEVRGSIPVDAVLLDYVVWRDFDPRREEPKRWGENRYGVYVVKASGAIRFVDLGEASGIDPLVRRLRQALSGPSSVDAGELSQQLTAKIIQPISAELNAFKNLIIAPDGLLNLVPFGALKENADQYLAQRYTLTYVGSGRDLLRLKNKTPSNNSVVVLADPDYSGVSQLLNTEIKPLPGTAGEASAIAGLYKQAQLYSQANASETTLKNVQHPKILHIATHGVFLADSGAEEAAQAAQRSGRDIAVVSQIDNPLLRSGLILAGGDSKAGNKDDGVLTALEAATLDLTGTQLAVLSACETGVGEVKNGQGVFGLRQAFAVAGAETVVMSLWKVDDSATKDLMTNYYQRLNAGEGRAEALRQAQLALLKQPQTAHPYYWASFISSGQWLPLRQ